MTDIPAKDKLLQNPAGTGADSVRPDDLLRSLEQFMASVIGEQLTAMLDSADEILFEMAEQAGNGPDQRLYFDALRVLRIERARLLRSFQDNLSQAFAAGRSERAAANVDLDDMDSWSIQDSEQTEETVAAANLESKATELYQKDLLDLESRLGNLSNHSAEEISPKLVAPARIFDAFRHTVRGLEVEFPIKRVIYRLAERSLVGNLGQVYSGANQMLESRGYSAIRGMRPARPAPAAPAKPVLDRLARGGAAAWPSGLSATRLLEGLVAASAQTVDAANSYTDAQLAAEIGGALDAMAQGRPYDGWVQPGNIALAGQMFETLYQDRQLSDSLRPLLRRLQYPVMKTALADARFFTDVQHPVRQLVHEVFDMLTSADSASEAEIARLSELIDELLRQFQVGSEQLGRPEGRAPAVAEADADKFLAELKERQAAQRTRTLEKVRRLVAQELKLRTLARSVPESLMPLLLSGFGPLLSVNLLRGGIQGLPWQDSTQLLDRLLDSIEPQRLPHQHQSVQETEIVNGITERLIGIGLPHDKVQKLVGALLEVYQAQALDQAVQPVVGINAGPAQAARVTPEMQDAMTAQQALAAVLVPGSWFQVWDAPNRQRRWLKLSAYLPGRDAVVFDDFTGEHQLRIHASSLIRDLVAGHSAPVDPNPAVQRSITLLAPLLAMLPASAEPAAWAPKTAS